jgi:hypothetical protein
MTYRPSSGRFRSDGNGYFGLRGGLRFDAGSTAGGTTLGSGIEGALVSVSGYEVVLDNSRHYHHHTLFPHAGDSGIEGNVGGSSFRARMDDRFVNRPSSQRGGSGAGLGDSGFHARMEAPLDGFPSSQSGGSGAGLGGSCFHARMDDRFDNRPSSQRGGFGAGVGGCRFHARMDDCLDGFPSSQCGDSGAGLGGSRSDARMDDRFDDHPSSQRGGSGAGLGGTRFHARMDDHFVDSLSSHQREGVGPCNTVSKSQLPWSTWPWWGIFYQIKKRSYKTTIYQENIMQTISYYLNT